MSVDFKKLYEFSVGAEIQNVLNFLDNLRMKTGNYIRELGGLRGDTTSEKLGFNLGKPDNRIVRPKRR